MYIHIHRDITIRMYIYKEFKDCPADLQLTQHTNSKDRSERVSLS
jgi:hypothetical protein